MALQTKTLTADGSNGHHRFTLTITEDSTATVSNSSVISWEFKLSPIVAYYDWNYNNAVSYTVTINGTKYTGTISSYDGVSTVTLQSGGSTIIHNADGSKSISYSISVTSYNQYYLPGSASASGTMTLTKIARAATLTSAPNFNDEQNPVINYSNPAGNNVTTLKACITAEDGTALAAYRDISKTGSSYTFTLTDAERNKMRAAAANSKTISVKFYVTTTMGGNTYYSSLTKTLTITNANPTVTFTARDGAGFGGVTGDASKVLIKGVSYLNYTITATGNKGATIKSYSITDGSTTQNTATGTFWTINNPTFTYTVTDSRGNKTTGTKTFTIIDYIKPTCNLTATNPTAAGDMTINISGNFFIGAIGASENIITIEYRYKENSGSYTAWKMPTETTLKNNTYNTSIDISGLNYKSTYTIEARVQDLIYVDGNYKGAVFSEAVKVKSIPVFDWGEDDFNFNVPVYINNVEMDYIVEQGTTGIWRYRKWNSGIAECWGTTANKSVDCSTVWGTIKVNNVDIPTHYCKDKAIGGISYPFEFSSTPIVQATFDYAGQYNYWTYTGDAGTKTTTPSYGVIRPTQATVTAKVHFYAMGKWK